MFAAKNSCDVHASNNVQEWTVSEWYSLVQCGNKRYWLSDVWYWPLHQVISVSADSRRSTMTLLWMPFAAWYKILCMYVNRQCIVNQDCLCKCFGCLFDWSSDGQRHTIAAGCLFNWSSDGQRHTIAAGCSSGQILSQPLVSKNWSKRWKHNTNNIYI